MTELVQQEISKEETNVPVQQSTPETNNAATTQTEENPQDRDWRKWRENRQKEREEAARIDAARRKAEEEARVLREALEAVVNKPNHQQRQYDQSDDIEESEEARIDRRVAEALSKKEKEYERQRQEREAQEYPQKLRSTFKDFEQVCTSENLDYLEFHHPELAKSLATRNQSFEKWADIYSAIKRYIPNPDSRNDAKKAEKNLQKPQSLSHSVLSAGNEQMSSARLTEDRRKANWERMQRTLKGLS